MAVEDYRLQHYIPGQLGGGSDTDATIGRKVAGVVAGCNPKKNTDAIDAEAEKRAVF